MKNYFYIHNSRIYLLYSIVLLLIVVLFSCSGNNKGNGDEISSTSKESLRVFNITNLQGAKKISLTEMGCEDIHYIPLETNLSSILSGIKQIKAAKDVFVILDYKRITSFTTEGKFLTEIGKKGKGPKEYLYPNDFSFNKKCEKTYILSDKEDKIYSYDVNGEFIESIACPTYTTDIFYMNDIILCYSGNRNGTIEHSFNMLNLKGEELNKIQNKFPYKPSRRYSTFSNECLFFSYKNHAYAKEVCSDTVYILSGLDLIPNFILNQGDKSLPATAREEGKWGPNITKKYITQRKLFIVNDNLYYEFTNSGNYYGFWGSFKDKKSVLINLNNGIINDIDGGINLKFNLSTNDGALISWISANELKAHLNSKMFKNSIPKFPKKKKELEKLGHRLDENDNPVLMIVKLKS